MSMVHLFSDMYIHVQNMTHVYFNMSSVVQLDTQLFGLLLKIYIVGWTKFRNYGQIHDISNDKFLLFYQSLFMFTHPLIPKHVNISVCGGSRICHRVLKFVIKLFALSLTNILVGGGKIHNVGGNSGLLYC